MTDKFFTRFEGSEFQDAGAKGLSEFHDNCDQDAKRCFVNLIKTPSGFEFDIHATGQLKPPQRLEKGDSYEATFLLPFSPSLTLDFLNELIPEASEKPNRIAWIKRTLAEYRWKPESKGFGQ